jgi:general secretion pathway protein H
MASMLTSVPGTSSKHTAALIHGPLPGRTDVKSKTQQGFSLLELLVVIVIVSILFSLTTLAIRGTSPEELIQTEAQRLDRLLQLATEEAILKGMEYGIEFKTSSYRFLVYAEQSWQPLEADKLLRERMLPENMEIELLIDAVDVVIEESEEEIDEQTLQTSDTEASENKGLEKETIKPQVFLLSSGEITPAFSVRIFMPGVETSYLVSGTLNGEHWSEISEL